jgi:hypothetical protein
MKMKKRLLPTVIIVACCLSVCIASPIYSQNGSAQDSYRKTLYNFHKQPTSCAENFENLFNVWSTDNIVNANDFRLLSYTFHGIVEDTAHIDSLAKTMINWNSPMPSIFSSSFTKNGTTFTGKGLRVNTYAEVVESVPAEEIDKARETLEKEMAAMRETLAETIKIGYKIFTIRFEYLGKDFVSYALCNPQTHEVAADMLFNMISF